MHRRVALLAFVALAATAGSVATQACGSPSPDPNDGGSSACPTYSGSNAYCKAMVAQCARCGAASIAFVSGCRFSRFTQYCDDLVATYSGQCLDLEITQWSGACDAGGSQVCDQQFLADASPTAAQARAAADYCLVCGDGGECASAITSKIGLTGLSDTVCNAIDQTCTPDASSACGAYSSCATNVATAQAEVLANFCLDAGAD